MHSNRPSQSEIIRKKRMSRERFCWHQKPSADSFFRSDCDAIFLRRRRAMRFDVRHMLSRKRVVQTSLHRYCATRNHYSSRYIVGNFFGIFCHAWRRKWSAKVLRLWDARDTAAIENVHGMGRRDTSEAGVL